MDSKKFGIYDLNLADINFKKRSVNAEEKGGRTHIYKITGESLAAITEYIKKEGGKFKRWRSPALFFLLATTAHGKGRLSPRVINTVLNEVSILDKFYPPKILAEKQLKLGRFEVKLTC